MDPAPQHRGFSLSAGEDVHRAIRQLRLAGGLMILALVLVIAAAGIGIIVQLVRPSGGRLSTVVLSGFVGIVALAAGLAVLELAVRRAKAARTLGDAVGTYRTSCIIAGGLNFAAALYTINAIFTSGLAGGLWLPQVLVVAVNILGLIIAVPRIKHLRRLHYSPALPYSRI